MFPLPLTTLCTVPRTLSGHYTVAAQRKEAFFYDRCVRNRKATGSRAVLVKTKGVSLVLAARGKPAKPFQWGRHVTDVCYRITPTSITWKWTLGAGEGRLEVPMETGSSLLSVVHGPAAFLVC